MPARLYHVTLFYLLLMLIVIALSGQDAQCNGPDNTYFFTISLLAVCIMRLSIAHARQITGKEEKELHMHLVDAFMHLGFQAECFLCETIHSYVLQFMERGSTLAKANGERVSAAEGIWARTISIVLATLR